MKKCIFCKIAKGEEDAAKIWEDDDFIAILDTNPNVKGMSLVLTKRHYDSYAFDLPDEVYTRLMIAAKKVAKILERGLNVKRVDMVMEGTAINHIHIKLYPLHGLERKDEESVAKERIFFEKYEGYISTLLGPTVDISELKKLADEIKEKAGLI
ncbi:MAG: HIT domain-containing protein [Candidatus Aenigmarchaeota archaeon]|nr:HIT domain-containing protein [Candidatus Aenigmarchaeota archaeon]